VHLPQNEQAPSEQQRAKLSQIFRFAQALNNLQNPAPRQIAAQPWSLWLADLPDHPGIRSILSLNSQKASQGNKESKITEREEDFVLKVSRPRLTEPPVPPQAIIPLLPRDWQDSSKDIILNQTGEAALKNNSPLLRIYELWLARYRTWLEAEQPSLNAMRIYNTLYELHSKLERESEILELILGDGILLWSPSSSEAISHPVLLSRLQLNFDPQIPEFTITETNHPPEFYSTLLQALPEVNAANLGECRIDFEQQRYHPLAGDETAQFLRRLIYHISPKGEYTDSLTQLTANRNIPRMTRRPVIFLRHRTLGFSIALEKILEDIPQSSHLPSPLLRLADVNHGYQSPIVQDEGIAKSLYITANGEHDHILLSKPANAEQLEIARRLERNDAVLVQGPPGTGKTHTIANLLGHLLAQGKSVLVTSHTSKALRVLREKVVEPLQPLCVSILEDDSRKEMENAIDAITERLSFAQPAALERDIHILSQQRSGILQQLSQSRQELTAARNSEYEAIVFAGQQVAPSEAARYVRQHVDEYGWLPGPVETGVSLPLSLEEIVSLFSTNRTVSAQDEQEMIVHLPETDLFISAPLFSRIIDEQAQLQKDGLDHRRDLWREPQTTSPSEILSEIQPQLELALDVLRDQTPWRLAAINAGREGGLSRQPWDDLLAKIEQVYDLSLQAQPLIWEYNPEIRDQDLQPERVEKNLNEIIQYLESGKKIIGLTLFMHSQWKTLINATRVKGKSPTEHEHFLALRAYLQLQMQREELIGRWQRQMFPLGGVDATTLRSEPEKMFHEYAPHLRQRLQWYLTAWEPLETALALAGLRWDILLSEMPIQLADNSELLKLREAVFAHLPIILAAEIRRRQYAVNEKKLTTLKEHFIGLNSASANAPVIKKLRIALDTCNVTEYAEALQRLNDLHDRQKDLRLRHILLTRLEKYAPGWSAAIRRREGLHGKSELPGDPQEAWRWRQLRDELERRARVSLEELQTRIERLSGELYRITAELVEKKAWLAQIHRTTPQQRQDLQVWKEIMRKVGKGTGKRAPRLLAQARELIPSCQSAVPVWIMPLHRVVQNFDPRKNRFDVVIIDEASQADIKALTALYMGKQIVIVGDDEQVSPLGIGQDIESIQKQIDEYLRGIPHAEIFDSKLSIYTLAKTVLAIAPICLLEHFRCVSPIIQFSNNLSYNGKIKPLRDDSDAILRPSTVAYRVQSSEVKANINEVEAQTIVSLILAATRQAEYKDATFGVISLWKEEQATYIDGLLRKYLTPNEYVRRRILCGKPAQFQGDERDVVFLSLVEATHEKGPLMMRNEEGHEDRDKKRYNVAASRARDQLWVVHSLDPDVDLKDGDLRKKLILHAKNPAAFAAVQAELEKKTDSEFERLVLRQLRQAGYHIVPQWKVGSYRIDLVVEGGGKRLAVECDGDRWHPIEKLEEDMARQAILERLGWRFIRIRGSLFFRNPDKAMEAVFSRLDELEIPRESLSEKTRIIDQEGKELLAKVIRQAEEVRQGWSVKKPSQIGTTLSSTNTSGGYRARK
jgi:very-short-patch-repair endonuclease